MGRGNRSSRGPMRMPALRHLSYTLALALAVLVGVSCGTDRMPTAPTTQPEFLLGELTQRLGLLQCRPLPYAAATKTIGPAGGYIDIGPHRLVIPAGALNAPVTITAEAPVGTVNSVRFEPEGLEFEQSAYLTMSYANCDLLGRLLPKRIAYVTDDLGSILYYLLSLDNIWAKKVTGQLDHFSRYAVSW